MGDGDGGAHLHAEVVGRLEALHLGAEFEAGGGVDHGVVFDADLASGFAEDAGEEIGEIEAFFAGAQGAGDGEAHGGAVGGDFFSGGGWGRRWGRSRSEGGRTLEPVFEPGEHRMRWGSRFWVGTAIAWR
jgi:hypothetical protein